MLTNQFLLPVHSELVVDLFAGGSGASTGIEQAIGRHVDIAVNHDPEAISLHTANHPQTRHFCSDVYKIELIQMNSRAYANDRQSDDDAGFDPLRNA